MSQKEVFGGVEALQSKSGIKRLSLHYRCSLNVIYTIQTQYLYCMGLGAPVPKP